MPESRSDGRDDKAKAVRIFWPAVADSLEMGMSVEQALAMVERNARSLGRQARQLEEATALNRE